MLNLQKSTAAKAVAPLNLTKSAPKLLSKLSLHLNWEGATDLDAVAVLSQDGKFLEGDHTKSLVAYPMHNTDAQGNILSYNWEVDGFTYSGDARDGDQDSADDTLPDEEIGIVLSEVRGNEITLFLTSYSHAAPVTFGSSIAPTATLVDGDGNKMVDITLDTDAAFGTAFKLVRIFQKDGAWLIENVNELVGSSANGLEDVLATYA